MFETTLVNDRAPKPFSMGFPPGARLCLAILSAIRSHSSGMVPINDLPKITGSYINISHHSLRAGFERSCLRLFELGLIEFCGADSTIGDSEIIDSARKQLRAFSLFENDPSENGVHDSKQLFCALHPNCTEILHNLCISLSAQIKMYRGSLLVYPLFSVRGYAGEEFKSPHVNRSIFVIMPFNRKMDRLYNEIIVPCCEEIGVAVNRGDDITGSNQIMDDVWNAICRCDLVIAECSSLNANVYYELGIAHTVGRRSIILTNDIEACPFDLRHWRHLVYAEQDKSTGMLAKRLKSEVSKELKSAARMHDLG